MMLNFEAKSYSLAANCLLQCAINFRIISPGIATYKKSHGSKIGLGRKAD